MRVLATGMTWPSLQPGGLNSYFSDYLIAWQEAGGDIRALVAAGSELSLPRGVRSVIHTGGFWGVWREWKAALADELRRTPAPDVVNAHFAYFAQPLVSLSVEQPVVTHFHGPWAYEAKLENVESRNRWSSSARFQVMKRMESRLYQKSDQFIVLSAAFRDVLVKYYDIPMERIHVIPGAVNTQRFCEVEDRERVRIELGLPQNRTLLLSVRRLARRMGLENLLAAVDSLRWEFPQLYLVIVGGGELYGSLRQEIEVRGIGEWVRLVGKVSDEQLPLYYQTADLSVVPSLALEGFGLVTVESMACGTPVAGTPVGGTKEILAGHASQMLFEGSAQSDVEAGLARILSHPELWPDRHQTRQHVVENYTWPVVVQKVGKVFSDVQT